MQSEIYMRKLSQVLSHAWDLWSSFHGPCDCMFLTERDPKHHCQLKMEWILTLQATIIQNEAALIFKPCDRDSAWPSSRTLRTTLVGAHPSQIPFDTWYLDVAGPCYDPTFTFCCRHPTPESLILLYRSSVRGGTRKLHGFLWLGNLWATGDYTASWEVCCGLLTLTFWCVHLGNHMGLNDLKNIMYNQK